MNNNIGFNNTAGFDYSWEAGGIWFSKSTNMVVQEETLSTIIKGSAFTLTSNRTTG